MSELINLIRYYHFMAGVLSHQQTDHLCANCKAFANTADRIKEGVVELEIVHAEGLSTLSYGGLRMLKESREKIKVIKTSGDAVGQKKAGNCMLPEGVCFIKIPKTVLDKL
jgi:hypothetical protein